MHDYFVEWQSTARLLRIHHAVYMEARELGKEASPTSTVVDSQSVKATEKGGAHRSCGLNGKKRHAAVDTLGLMLAVSHIAWIARRAEIANRPGSLQSTCWPPLATWKGSTLLLSGPQFNSRAASRVNTVSAAS